MECRGQVFRLVGRIYPGEHVGDRYNNRIEYVLSTFASKTRISRDTLQNYEQI